jgi:aquaporin Z
MARRQNPAAPTAPAQEVSPSLAARLGAEVLGTFILVFGGAGTAIFAANFPYQDGNPLGVGFVGVALAFGLTVLAGAYAVGHISGGHFNPAVTIGLAVGRQFEWKDTVGYIVAQIVGGALASTLLFAIAAGGPDGFLQNAQDAGFAANGFGEHSPGGFGLVSAILAEVILTAVFLFVILGVTDRRASAGFAGLTIGLTLTLIHLISIPITNTSVNPARSIATAIYAGGGGWAWGQLWVFILAPIVGAAIAGLVHYALFASRVPARA